jgi:hypothetical protein
MKSKNKKAAVEIIIYLVAAIIIAIVAYSILSQFLASSPIEKAMSDLKETVEKVCEEGGKNQTILLYVPAGQTIKLKKEGLLVSGSISKKLRCPENVTFKECETFPTREGEEGISVNVTKIEISTFYKIELAGNASCSET